MAEFEKKTKSYWLLASKLRVKPTGENMDRSAGGVIGGIVDKLIIEGETRPCVKAVGVVSLENLLRLITKCAIADQYPSAAPALPASATRIAAVRPAIGAVETGTLRTLNPNTRQSSTNMPRIFANRAGRVPPPLNSCC